jgi:VIT1/CCC1 family predicted Fe2+/Mn2+ transporter
MAAGNALRAHVDRGILARARAEEEAHVDVVPEGEREEVRQIFAAKGFDGSALEEAVSVVTSDRRRWVETMLREEHGLSLAVPSPRRTAVATFAAFVGAGLLPLLPLALSPAVLPERTAFAWCVAATAVAFLGAGAAKGALLRAGRLRSALQVLVVGGAAAAIAWAVGHLGGHAGG